METSLIPDFTDIIRAHRMIEPYIHRTPVLTSVSINEITGAEVFFKCENFQKVGAFKFRGATHAVLSLSEKEAVHGVATHSSGNHAAALALAAHTRGIPCYVAMPETAPKIKIEAVRSYGAVITFCKPTLASREETLQQILRDTAATFVHPFDNFNVICGQGTAARELLQEQPRLDSLLVPVGGGGLLSGSALTAKAMTPGIRVIGCEPANADDACRSYYSGTLLPSVNPQTLADGLLTALSERTFTIIRSHVDDILTVSEAAIVRAMRMVWQRMKIVIEPSSAVPVAVLMEHPQRFTGHRVGLIISGGNCDLSNLPFQES